MKERPILMSAPMVRAILDGTKTQTRRVVRYKTSCLGNQVMAKHPYGAFGDQLWVRETWKLDSNSGEVIYRAYGLLADDWRPSIFMPRSASRIQLEVQSVKAERLQEISASDALAEGVEVPADNVPWNPCDAYADLWDSINGERASWESNPWVWVVSFKRVKP